MTNVDKYIQLYENQSEVHYKKFGYYFPPRTIKQYEEINEKYYINYLNTDKYNKDLIKKTKAYANGIWSIGPLGTYLEFKRKDFGQLNNVLFQASRHNLILGSLLASGTDHCNMLSAAIRSFAANDFEIIQSIFPEKLPQAKGRFYTENSVNLLKIMYYNQTEFVDSAITEAQSFLNRKITNWERYVVLYFLALYHRDLSSVNHCLQKLCSSYQRRGYPITPIDKCFATEIHGLYRFAKIIDESFFEQIVRPKHKSFIEDFEIWQKNNNYPKGRVYYKYPKELDYLNRYFKVEIPKVELIEKNIGNRKRFLKDVEAFKINLTNILQF